MTKVTVSNEDDGATLICIQLNQNQQIAVNLVDGPSGLGGSVESDGLHEKEPLEEDWDGDTDGFDAKYHSWLSYEGAIHGLESFILSLACAGVDITSEAFVGAIETTLDSIGNNFSDTE
jgi:hypothetical protein